MRPASRASAGSSSDLPKVPLDPVARGIETHLSVLHLVRAECRHSGQLGGEHRLHSPLERVDEITEPRPALLAGERPGRTQETRVGLEYPHQMLLDETHL